MSDAKLEILLAAKETAGTAFAKVEKYADDLSRQVLSLNGVMSAFAAGGMGYMIKQNMVMTEEMQKNATMAGLSVRAFQELSFAGDQYMVSQEALTDGFKELNLRADEFIKTGAGPGKDAFEALGYSQSELNKKLADAPALFKEIIDRMEGMSKASKMRLADEIFGGTGGEQFVAMIEGGSDAIEDFTKKANELGLVLDEKAARGAIEANKAIDTLTQQLNTEFTRAVGALAPDIGVLAENMGDWIAQNRDFIKDDIPKYIDDIATAAGSLGGVLSDMTKNVAVNAQAFALAKEGQISWVDYITKSTNELKEMVQQFDALAGSGKSFREWQDEMDALTRKYEVLGRQIEMVENTTLVGEPDTAKLEAQRDEITKQIKAHRSLIETKKEGEAQDKKAGEIAEAAAKKNIEFAKVRAGAIKNVVEMTKAEMEALDDLIKVQGEVKESWYDIDRQTYTNSNDDAVAAAKAYYEAWEKGRDKAKEVAEDIADAMEEMNRDLELSGEERYQNQKKLLDAEKKDYELKGVSQNLVDKWHTSEHEKLLRQRTLDSDKFFAGLKIGFEDSEKDFKTWAEHGESISKSMSSNMHSAFSDTLFLALKGDLEDISQVWDSFFDSMLHKLTDTVAEMAIQWGVGAIGGVTGWWDTGAWEIKRDHVAMVHEGEMIVPADVAAVVRGGDGSPNVNELAQVSPHGGHEWGPTAIAALQGTLGGWAPYAAQGVSLAAQGYISLEDLAKGLINPGPMMEAAATGGLTTAVNERLGMRSSRWGTQGQSIAAAIGTMAGGPLAGVLAGLVGGTIGMAAGDAADARKFESFRDSWESYAIDRAVEKYGSFLGTFGGWMGAQQDIAKALRDVTKAHGKDFDFTDPIGSLLDNTVTDLSDPIGYDLDYGGTSSGDDGPSKSTPDPDDSGYGGYGGIGGWAEGGVIDRLMVPYGEDGWAAVQFGEGVVSKDGMETLAKINQGNLEGYSANENAGIINVTNNIQADVLSAIGDDLPTDLKLQNSGIVLDEMNDVVALFDQIATDGIDTAELKTAYQSFVGIGLAAGDAATATKLLIDEYQRQEQVAAQAFKLTTGLNSKTISSAMMSGGNLTSIFNKGIASALADTVAGDLMSGYVDNLNDQVGQAFADGGIDAVLEIMPDLQQEMSAAQKEVSDVVNTLNRLANSGQSASNSVKNLNRALDGVDNVMSMADASAWFAEEATEYVSTLESEIEARRGAMDEIYSTIDGFENLKASVVDFQSDLLTGATALTSDVQYAQARKQLTAAYMDLQSGDSDVVRAAMEDLPGLGRQFISASENYRATAGGLNADFGYTMEVLNAAGLSFDNQISMEEMQIAELEVQTGHLSSLIDEVVRIADYMGINMGDSGPGSPSDMVVYNGLGYLRGGYSYASDDFLKSKASAFQSYPSMYRNLYPDQYAAYQNSANNKMESTLNTIVTLLTEGNTVRSEQKYWQEKTATSIDDAQTGVLPLATTGAT